MTCAPAARPSRRPATARRDGLALPPSTPACCRRPPSPSRRRRWACPAIMVTGSHIPFDRNGLKFYRAEGEISKADEQRILACDVRRAAADGGAARPLPPVDAQPLALYLARYREAFERGPWRACASASTNIPRWRATCCTSCSARLGAETMGLARSDSFVAIDTEAVRRRGPGAGAGLGRRRTARCHRHHRWRCRPAADRR